jgi:hypothetical protein
MGGKVQQRTLVLVVNFVDVLIEEGDVERPVEPIVPTI